ncbi:hypothetical protein Syun_019397 [Stephania yunnanensis]|uniref:Uncharacterized protein n=1 Tax=Stephania yunnanensis TaxID=152371 RepID=A0AAP0NXY9_9MAGN
MITNNVNFKGVVLHPSTRTLVPTISSYFLSTLDVFRSFIKRAVTLILTYSVLDIPSDSDLTIFGVYCVHIPEGSQGLGGDQRCFVDSYIKKDTKVWIHYVNRTGSHACMDLEYLYLFLYFNTITQDIHSGNAL